MWYRRMIGGDALESYRIDAGARGDYGGPFLLADIFVHRKFFFYSKILFSRKFIKIQVLARDFKNPNFLDTIFNAKKVTLHV